MVAERPVLALSVLMISGIFGIMAIGPAYWLFAGYHFSVWALIAIAGMTIGLLGVLLPYIGGWALFLALYFLALAKAEAYARGAPTLQQST